MRCLFISYLSDWQKYKNLTILNVDKNVENQDISYNAYGNFIVFIHC